MLTFIRIVSLNLTIQSFVEFCLFSHDSQFRLFSSEFWVYVLRFGLFHQNENLIFSQLQVYIYDIYDISYQNSDIVPHISTFF